MPTVGRFDLARSVRVEMEGPYFAGFGGFGVLGAGLGNSALLRRHPCGCRASEQTGEHGCHAWSR